MKRVALVGAMSLALASCESEESCEEDPQAQVLEETRTIEIDGEAFEAEVADDQTARERGWRFRRCDREALLLIPDEPGPLPIWGCELAEPVDVLFVQGGEVVELVTSLMPCSPCSACTLVGEGIDVDAVVELPAEPGREASTVSGI